LKTLNAAIIGCGNIAGFYDTPTSKKILTHAHALMNSKQTKLIACCDINQNNLNTFVDVWGKNIRTYTKLEEMFEKESLDIIVIASITQTHYEILKTILQQTKIKHILCEKPFVSTIQEYGQIIPLIQEEEPNLLINYIRCFDPSLNKIKKLLEKKKLGNPLYFSTRINKGLYHNGSHMLSLVENFFGEITDFKTTNKKVINDDVYGSFWIQTKTIDGVLINSFENNFALFEMEIICQNGIVKISDSGFKIRVYAIDEVTKKLQIYKKYPNTLQFYAKNSLDYLLQKNSKKEMNKHLNFSYRLLKIKEDLLQGDL